MTSLVRTLSTIRVYYYFLLGGTGGVTAWFITAMMRGATAEGGPNQSTGILLFQGAVLGALIGLGAGVYDGLSSRSLIRTVKFGAVSALCGLIAGAIALPLVQALYKAAGDASAGAAVSMLAGTMCWILFGGLLGLGEGFGKGSQFWKGLVGGMVGGALGGGIYELAGRPTGGSQGHPAMLAFTVTMLGGAVGAAIALVTTVLKDAWLVVENGPLAGTEINISKYVHPQMGRLRAGIIGNSEWEANIYLPGDTGVVGKHASIGYSDGVPLLTVLSSAREIDATTLVNRRPVSTWPLSDGDRVQVGATVLQYRHKR